jgi:arylsulfatase A-like enzyme
VFLLAVLVGVLCAGPAWTGEQKQRPHIIYFLADDLGWADVGWHGKEIRTPNLDKLANTGARLEQFYVQPLCSPTRAALLTGRYPMRYGLQVGVVRPWARYGLPLEERTLAGALKDAGYTTAIVGKWHLGHFQRDYLPMRRGFDHQYGPYNGAIDYFNHTREGGFDWHRDDRVNRDEGYTTHLIAREVVRLIQEHDGKKPLFIYVPFNAPHAPHQVPAQYKKPYADLKEPRRSYAGMVAAVDEAVGQVVGAIDKKGLTKQTLFLFSSDNGGPAPDRVTSNGPLRGAKGSLFEGGVRVPAFACWPGQIKPGTVVEAPLHIVDWYPTLLKLAGASLRQKLPIDGKDAWPAITQGKLSPHEFILINAAPGGGALRAGDWKLLVGAPQSPGGLGKGKNRKNEVHLYNLADDIGEKKNLADEKPEKVKELRALYDRLAREAVAPKVRPKPADFRAPKVWGEE